MKSKKFPSEVFGYNHSKWDVRKRCISARGYWGGYVIFSNPSCIVNMRPNFFAFSRRPKIYLISCYRLCFTPFVNIFWPILRDWKKSLLLPKKMGLNLKAIIRVLYLFHIQSSRQKFTFDEHEKVITV